MGELEKRINTVWEERLKTKFIVTMDPEDFLDLVEEAKKEFPPVALNSEGYPKGWSHTELRQWFEKYFGEGTVYVAHPISKEPGRWVWQPCKRKVNEKRHLNTE
jgi:hypothetical protein